eukprot:gene16906-8393_t
MKAPSKSYLFQFEPPNEIEFCFMGILGKDSLLPRPPGGHSTLSAAMSALVAISVVAVVAVLIGFVVYRKMRRNKHADGLPYQIELNYDEETDPSFRDDL